MVAAVCVATSCRCRVSCLVLSLYRHACDQWCRGMVWFRRARSSQRFLAFRGSRRRSRTIAMGATRWPSWVSPRTCRGIRSRCACLVVVADAGRFSPTRICPLSYQICDLSCGFHSEAVPPFPVCRPASVGHSPAKLQAPWPNHTYCRWKMSDVIQKADYVASTEPLDLADHEVFFWTQSMSSSSGCVLPRCVRAWGRGVLGFCAGGGAMREQVSRCHVALFECGCCVDVDVVCDRCWCSADTSMLTCRTVHLPRPSFCIALQEGHGPHGLVDDRHPGPALLLRVAQSDDPRASPVAENGRRLAGPREFMLWCWCMHFSDFSVASCHDGQHVIIVLRA